MAEPFPPGPRDGLFGITFLRPFCDTPLDFMIDVAQRYGDFAFFRLGWHRVYLVHRPELIREVLTTRVKSFHKLRRLMKQLGKIEGNGLVVAEGEAWRKHRPVVQPAFHASHFQRYARVMVEHTRRRLRDWPTDRTLDFAEEMNQLALEIIAEVVFDVDWSDKAARLRAAVHLFREYMLREAASIFPLPDWLPLPGKIRQRRAVRAVHQLIWDLLRERRSPGGRRDDMLTMMLSAAAEVGEDSPISDREIRDEAATLFVAGHDTTSAALAWFFYLLARHPEVERRLLAEVEDVLAGRPATFEDVGRLRYTERVVKESMRLYPAAGLLFGREAVEDVPLGGYTLPRGSWVFISPYVVQRDPRYFPNPEVFDPDRFAAGRVDEIPAYSYLPFGGGPRICIGSSLATMELVLVAATVLQHFQVRLAPDQGEVKPEVRVVSRIRGGLRVRLTAREEVAAPLIPARAVG